MTSKDESGAEPRIDLDLTPLLPQVLNLKMAGRVFAFDTRELKPVLCYEIGEVGKALNLAMKAHEDTEAIEAEMAAMVAQLLHVSLEESVEIGWQAHINLFAFLAKPLNDLAVVIRLSGQP